MAKRAEGKAEGEREKVKGQRLKDKGQSLKVTCNKGQGTTDKKFDWLSWV
jgi:hypothetical protein